MKKPAPLFIVLVALAASVALAGCGGGSADVQTSQAAARGTGSASEPKTPDQEFTPSPQVKDEAPPGDCGTELSATDHSSAGCVFAENVRAAYYEYIGTGPGTVDGYSPATGSDSEMRCTGGKTHRCTGAGATVTFP